MTFQEERLQFLNDTVFFFGTNPKRRAVIKTTMSSIPKYKTKDGRCCAIGRHIPANLHPEKLTGSVQNLFLCEDDMDRGVSVSIQNYLPSKIYLLGLNFLNAVSNLHDKDGYWLNKGLSWTGFEQYKWIVENFCGKFIEYENHF